MKAVWNHVVIAQSDDIVEFEGVSYFPFDSLDMVHMRPGAKNTICPYKGMASYYDIVVAGQVNKNAVWTYTHPTAWADEIRERVAFWQGVTLVPD